MAEPNKSPSSDAATVDSKEPTPLQDEPVENVDVSDAVRVKGGAKKTMATQ